MTLGIQGSERKPFRISTGLKDLIGRDLITDDFVAVFELVKNSFDAHARNVLVRFDEGRFTLVDDGKGMSREDILNKWLFIAYSAKRDGTEDAGYRDQVAGRSRPYAGAKGVGRFSCDRLGTELTLASRSRDQSVQVLNIDWTRFEADSLEEIGTVLLDLEQADAFPDGLPTPPGPTGTVLEVRGLRSVWDRERLRLLKRELTKLIDPFAGSASPFQIVLDVPSERDGDQRDDEHNKGRRGDQGLRLLVNGPVENPIIDVLGRRTTVIRIALVEGGDRIETALEDRGREVYRIREANPYPGLRGSGLLADVYYLNRGAKALFAHRMGLPAVQFGSIFLFRNGFRVFPVGKEDDDFFGLNRRKQQGQRRFLGGRDLIGRVDVNGTDGFNEATSRNQGLIRNPKVEQLIDCIRDKCVRRLERYVVDISWADKLDQEASDTSRMLLDENSALVGQLVSRLSATDGVELLGYDPDLVRIVDEKSAAFESSLTALELLAERTGDKDMLARVDAAKARVRALELAEAEARKAEARATSRAMVAEAEVLRVEGEVTAERERNGFLVAATSLDQDTILNLHHQIMIHAAEVQHGIQRMMLRLRGGEEVGRDDWEAFLEKVHYRNSQVIVAARFATKGGYRKQSAEVLADLSGYVTDYINMVASLWAPNGLEVRVFGDGRDLERLFRPIDVGILVDNLVANASKARASVIEFMLAVHGRQARELVITVADDGNGWPGSVSPLDRVFEKGVTTTDGSGLGLAHVRQVVHQLGGTVEAVAGGFSGELDGAKLVIRVRA